MVHDESNSLKFSSLRSMLILLISHFLLRSAVVKVMLKCNLLKGDLYAVAGIKELPHKTIRGLFFFLAHPLFLLFLVSTLLY